MVKVQNGIATREPLPQFLAGLAPESLVDLSWVDPALGVCDCAWWPEVNAEGALGTNKKWGAEVLTVDVERQVVTVTRLQVAMTAADKAARDATIAEQWAEKIAARRYAAEIAGTTVSGVQVYTTRESRGLIFEAAFSAQLDPESEIKFKSATGFVVLSAEQMLAVATGTRAYTQACFDREDALLAAVADGSITAALMDEGWPS